MDVPASAVLSLVKRTLIAEDETYFAVIEKNAPPGCEGFLEALKERHMFMIKNTERLEDFEEFIQTSRDLTLAEWLETL